jgi:hypothetical protein
VVLNVGLFEHQVGVLLVQELLEFLDFILCHKQNVCFTSPPFRRPLK